MSGASPDLEKERQQPEQEEKARKERRLHPRFNCEAPAQVRITNPAIVLSGNIRDLSLTGCAIELEQRFPVGINIRLEIMFKLHGLPVLIQGVSRCIHTPKLIGIEFIQVSLRKKSALQELIGELEEKTKLQKEAERLAAENGETESGSEAEHE